MTALHGDADGATYDRELDRTRLNRQRDKVWAIMSDHEWHTSVELEQRVGDSWAAVSARVRDLRKEKYGSHEVLRRRVANSPGLHEYRLLPPPPKPVSEDKTPLPDKLQQLIDNYKNRLKSEGKL